LKWFAGLGNGFKRDIGQAAKEPRHCGRGWPDRRAAALAGGRKMVRSPQFTDIQVTQGCVPGPACGDREDKV